MAGGWADEPARRLGRLRALRGFAGMDSHRSPRRRHERAADVEEEDVVRKKPNSLAGVPAAEAARHALDHDLSAEFDNAEVVRDRKPAKMVTALRLDLDTQVELETAASARGIGSSTLMRQIIEEWVATHRGEAAPDQLGELVRHLDAARQAAASLTHDRAA